MSEHSAYVGHASEHTYEGTLGSKYAVMSEARQAQGMRYDDTIMPKLRTWGAVAGSMAVWSFRCDPPHPVAMTMAIRAGIQAYRS